MLQILRKHDHLKIRIKKENKETPKQSSKIIFYKQKLYNYLEKLLGKTELLIASARELREAAGFSELFDPPT